MSSKVIFALAAGATLVAAISPAAASPGGVCARYANKAVSQQNVNLTRRCGFTGLRWHAWWDGHYNWCRYQTPDRLDWENARRSHKLAECRG
jgi:hypothetical protein